MTIKMENLNFFGTPPEVAMFMALSAGILY
jgi:hypothetical protein